MFWAFDAIDAIEHISSIVQHQQSTIYYLLGAIDLTVAHHSQIIQLNLSSFGRKIKKFINHSDDFILR